MCMQTELDVTWLLAGTEEVAPFGPFKITFLKCFRIAREEKFQSNI